MKLFVILSRVPYPLEKGDKLRAYHQLKYLGKSHEIYLCCLSENQISEDSLEHLQKICKEVHIFKLNKFLIWCRLFIGLFGSKPFQVIYFYQRNIYTKIQKCIDEFQPDHIYCQLIRTTEYAKHKHQYPKTIDYMDAFSKGIERRIHNAHFPMRWFLKEEHKRLVRYENLIFDYFDTKTIISDIDKALIFHPKRSEIKVISNGVDTDYFKPQSAQKKYDLLFLGNMNYPPNVDSSIYLVRRILPLIQKKFPDVRLLIAGANPHQKIRELAGENIEVSGWIEDIRDAYASAKIFIAPMRIGTGLQNKLLEAMAMGLPCITSDLVNTTLRADPGVEILIGKSEQSYADHVVMLLENDSIRTKIGAKGLIFVQSGYNWKVAGEKLERCLFGTKNEI